MKSPKDRLVSPYRPTHCETCDEMAKVTQRLVLNDGPLFAASHVADAVAHGVAKHSKSDWRERDGAYFLPKIIRHLHQHYGSDAMEKAVADAGIWGSPNGMVAAVRPMPPEYLDEESGVPHLAKAATNVLMALENYSNEEVVPEVEITPKELGMVYLAQPYSVKPSASFLAAKDISERGVADGVKLYSPVAFGHLVAPDAPYEYWLEHGLDMLCRCDSLVLVNDESLGPWQDSPGCVKEYELALELGKGLYQFNTAEWKLVRL